MELENKARFWVGVALVVPELIILIGFGLSLVDKSLMQIILIAAAILLYNGIAGILIWTGSRTKDKTCKKPKEEKKKGKKK